MREFKVLQMTSDGKELYVDFLMFQDYDAADEWANRRNEAVRDSVIDIDEVQRENSY